jgi:aminoglycoside phosphotransferase (APT) family kinase protein
MPSHITTFVADRWCIPAEQIRVKTRAIRGGLESAVTRADVQVLDANSDGIPPRLVVKELHGRASREADVYELLWKSLEDPPTARIFGSNIVGDSRYLFLEDVRSGTNWPWRDTAATEAVCRALAHLHDVVFPRGRIAFWDYEAELAHSARDTLAFAASARTQQATRVWQPIGELKRVVEALPQIRLRLLRAGTTLIHGDVHPGNVIVRPNESSAFCVALIDWGRARVGSPLEDVASWLHSLGCWEPEARRRHDTLLLAYLASRRSVEQLTTDLRKRYWFASVSNGLAGAIRHHIAVLSNPATGLSARTNSQMALRAWERVVRRAAALVPANRSHRIAATPPVRRSPTSLR